jgi:hypothetical protein
MGAQNEPGVRASLCIPARKFFDQADMVGAQVGKHMLDAQVGQALQEMVGTTGAMGRR